MKNKKKNRKSKGKIPEKFHKKKKFENPKYLH
jgi:hypothetical protein